SREAIIGTIVDNLIRDSGLLLFDQVLMRFNEILEKQVTPANDDVVSFGDKPEAKKIEDNFFRFGQPDIISRGKLLSLWSKKGLNLVKMTEENMPVPPGVIISAELITRPDIIKSAEFENQVVKEIAELRKYSKYPDLKLLLYARSGSAFMLPGLLVTIPNLGMNDHEAEGLAKLTGDAWFAYDTYAEFMRSYAINILGIPEEHFQALVNIYEKDKMSAEEMKALCGKYKEIVRRYGKGQTIPEQMIDQVNLAIDCVYNSWNSDEAREYRIRHKISEEWGSVVILQKGVFGNLNTTADGRISGTGVAALRLLPDGREVVQGKFRFRSIGDQLMSRADQNYILLSNSEKVRDNELTLEELQPEIYRKILDYSYRLKHIFGHYQMIEFTVELSNIWITQSNDDLIGDDYPEFVDAPEYAPISRGHGVSGGALRGWAANSFESVAKLLERYDQEKPEGIDGVILFLDRVNPEMINRIPKGVHIVARVISVHAETLAQKYGITAVYGVPDMAFNDQEKIWYVGANRMENGAVISIDGHENQLIYHNSGNIFLGSVPLAETTNGKIEIERRSAAAYERLTELRNRELWEDMVRRKAMVLTEYEKAEVIPVVEKFARGEAARADLDKYLVNCRVILDKIARSCVGFDFSLYGQPFKEALEKTLGDMGISLEVFQALNNNFYPRGDEHRKLLENVSDHLGKDPSENNGPDSVVVYNRAGKEQTLTYAMLRQAAYHEGSQGDDYYSIHKPQAGIKLVSFELDDVLDGIVKNSLEEFIDMFARLKAMGLKVAITSVNPQVLDWYHFVQKAYPEISQYIDFCHWDQYGPSLERYVDLLGLKPGEIMHIGNGLGNGFSGENFTAELHKRGYVSVLAMSPIVKIQEVLDKKIDAVLM
ncbi:MAG: PEP/pyruvate-binding domain-containing protein, partial [Candidatus Omnitrophica bacterium]|nr:PEP/pyruvate-binding domain-containing protein [Candidatus Omnitrophota bacterium]